MRKSPVLNPALHATPSRSTDSRYCRAGKAGVGVNSSMGVSANKRKLITASVCEFCSCSRACVFQTFSSTKHKAESFAVSLLQRCTFFFYNIITVDLQKSIVRCAPLPEFTDSSSHTHNPPSLNKSG